MAPVSLLSARMAESTARLVSSRALRQMTTISLGVGCERKSIVLFGLARKPLLLFRHRRGVRPQKGKSIESIVEHEIIQFSRLRLVDDLPRFVETLQGKGVVGEILVSG